MGLTSTAWQQVKTSSNVWTMDRSFVTQFNQYEIAEYPRFMRLVNNLSGNGKIAMAWNVVNGVWEWELDGWNWPWGDSDEETANKPVDGADYGTGSTYGNRNRTDSHNCKHEWVNISFHHFQLACKHCGIDKPEQ